MQQKKWLYVGGFIALFVVGLIFSVMPGKLANKALKNAQETLSKIEGEVKELESQVEKGANWYAEEYTLETETTLKNSHEELTKVTNSIDQASKAKTKEKRAYAAKALNAMVTIKESLAKTKEKIIYYQRVTQEARSDLLAAKNNIEEQKKNQSEIKQKLENKSESYLSKYVKLINEEITDAEKNICLAEELIVKIDKLLPPESDASKSGDPLMAKELLSQANNFISLATSSKDRAQTELSFQETALEKAGPSVSEAKTQFKKATEHFNTTVANTKLLPGKALQAAFTIKEKAEQALKQAEHALTTKVEKNKYDLVEAYKKASETSGLCAEVTKEVNRQVQLSKDASAGISSLESQLSKLAVSMASGIGYQSTLERYHNKASWSSVSGNLTQATQTSVTTAKLLTEVRALNEEQRFEEAVSRSNNGLREVNNASQLIVDLHNYSSRLENDRQQWPGAERKAQNTINDEEGYVDRYGKYNRSAQSDFEEAEGKLRSARSYASSRNYLEATNLALKATNLAEGTGRACKRSYDDEQDRIRREKEEAEERKREEIQKRSSSSGSSSSPWSGSSFSGGSSGSSSSGGSNHNSGSGYGSSSRSGDSGGYTNRRSSDGGGYDD